MYANKDVWVVCPADHNPAHCIAVAKFWRLSEILLQFKGARAALAASKVRVCAIQQQ